ncbi:MAG TPA: lipase, partial [Blastocatellia bacterium]|nr:lipase [Blastocatellia bacterium]
MKRKQTKLVGKAFWLPTAILISAAALSGCAANEGLPPMTEPAQKPAQTQTSSPQTDAQMQAVLDKLASLGGKPIETLSPAEARRQPTVADAVKALLEQQGKSTAPEPVAKVEDRMIAGAAGQIPARIYWPSGTGPFPVVLYIHGGGWV